MGLIRRSCLGALVVPVVFLLITLGVIAAAADRVSLWIAQRTVASQLEKAGARDAKVTAYGFPFLTQALRRNLHHVRVQAVSVTHRGLQADDVHLDMYDVRPLSRTSLDTRRLTGDGIVPFAQIERATRQPAGSLSAHGSEVQLRRTLRYGGRTVTVTGLATVAATSRNRVTGRLRSVRATGGKLPPPVLAAAGRQFTVAYAVPGLPAGVRVTRAQVAPTGVRVYVAGSNVRLSR